MALVLADRVLETTTSTGSGTITLAGATAGYQSFSVVGNGNTTFYVIAAQSGTDWEVGIGTYTASGTTLSRDTVLSSSAGGAKVTFSSGTKNVFVNYPAGRAVYGGEQGTVTISSLSATSAVISNLAATSANITTLTGTTISATNMGAQATTQFQAASANITTVTGTTAGFTSASITTVSGTTAGFTSASITTVTGTTAGFTSANITTVTGTTGTFTTSSDAIGNLRNIPSAGTAKTSAYTLAISDIGEFVTVGSGGSITVPNDIFVAGNAVTIYNDTTGNISINCPITTAYIAGTNTDKASMTLSTRGLATLLFVNPSLCVVGGNVS